MTVPPPHLGSDLRPRRRSRWRRIPLRAKVLYGCAAMLVLMTSGAVGLYYKLDANLQTEKIGEMGPRPPKSKANAAGQTPMNILALGSQTRDGQGAGFGNSTKLGTDISDTAMLIHLTADRKHAVVVSIPRDLIEPRPECRARVGKGVVQGASADMFDAAMSYGCPACAVATVEQFSDIRIDHFVRLDFNGFRKMTEVVHGVQVCVPPPGIHDTLSHLNIGAGVHTVQGNQALAFVRDRHGIGDGGDLGRIKMQQMFISSLINKIKSAGTLTNPVELYGIADAATSSLTTDPGLGSISKLLNLATQLRNLSTHDITFITAPNMGDPANPNRLVPQQPQMNGLWQLLRNDQPWTGKIPVPSTSGVTATDARKVKVKVLNASGVPGKAKQVAAQLKKLGFQVIGTGTTTAASTSVTYAGNLAANAGTLRGVLGGTPNVSDTGTGGYLTLVIGSDFGGVHAAHKAAKPSTATVSSVGVQTRSAAANICADLPKPRTDAG